MSRKQYLKKYILKSLPSSTASAVHKPSGAKGRFRQRKGSKRLRVKTRNSGEKIDATCRELGTLFNIDSPININLLLPVVETFQQMKCNE